MFLLITGETCQLPEIIPSSYSAANEKLSSDTAFLVEFELKCVNGLKVCIISIALEFTLSDIFTQCDKIMKKDLECE